MKLRGAQIRNFVYRLLFIRLKWKKDTSKSWYWSKSTDISNSKFMICNLDILSCETLWNYISSIGFKSISRINRMVAEFNRTIPFLKKWTHNQIARSHAILRQNFILIAEAFPIGSQAYIFDVQSSFMLFMFPKYCFVSDCLLIIYTA